MSRFSPCNPYIHYLKKHIKMFVHFVDTPFYYPPSTIRHGRVEKQINVVVKTLGCTDICTNKSIAVSMDF